MAWSYNPAALATSEKDQVRLEIGDTNEAAQLLSDEEINHAISMEANNWGAAARCCEIIARSYLRKADVRIGRGGTSITYTQQANQYQEMAAALRKRAIAMNAPWTGGTSKSDKASLAQDTDAVQPIFTKTLENNTFIGGETSDTPTNDAQADN